MKLNELIKNSLLASPFQRLLHVRFSPPAGDEARVRKIASPVQAENRACIRGLKCQGRINELIFMQVREDVTKHVN